MLSHYYSMKHRIKLNDKEPMKYSGKDRGTCTGLDHSRSSATSLIF